MSVHGGGVETDSNYYTIDGVLYPRVTSILELRNKPSLNAWRSNVGQDKANEISQSAAQIGKQFHEVAAAIGKGRHRTRQWVMPSAFRGMGFAYQEWFERNVEAVLDVYLTEDRKVVKLPGIGVERLCMSREHHYAGTSDLVARLRGDQSWSVVDIKTSKGYSDDWPLQLAGYRLALREEGIDVNRRLVVRVPKLKPHEAEVFEFEEHQSDEEAWLRLLGFWQWTQREAARRQSSKLAFYIDRRGA